MKKIIFLVGLTSLLSACSTTPHNEWAFTDSPHYGDHYDDPCIRCGEDWIFIPNEPHAASKQAKRVYGFQWGDKEFTPKY